MEIETPFGTVHTHVVDRAAQDGRAKERFSRQYYLYLGELATLSVQLVVPHRACGVAIELEADGEGTVNGHVALPPFGVYAGIDSWRLGQAFRRIVEELGVRRPHTWKRELGVRVHDWALWWRLWEDGSTWDRSRPAWRDGSWHPFGRPGERLGAERILEVRDDVIALPDGPAKCRATLSQSRRRSTVFPFLVRDGLRSVWVDFEGEGVDTGDDKRGPILGMGEAGDTIEEGLARLRVRILEDRQRNGWRAPEPAAAAS
jgi:hypothetical protein